MDARRSALVLTVAASLFLAAGIGNAQSPTPEKQAVVSPEKTTVVAAVKSEFSEASSQSAAAATKITDFRKPEAKPSARALLTLPRPLLLHFKYDTSSHNPECRCYDFRANLPKNKVVVLNFFSAKKYNVTSPQ